MAKPQSRNYERHFPNSPSPYEYDLNIFSFKKYSKQYFQRLSSNKMMIRKKLFWRFNTVTKHLSTIQGK